MCVATRCGVRKKIDILILLIPTPLVSVVLQQHPYFFSLYIIIVVIIEVANLIVLVYQSR